MSRACLLSIAAALQLLACTTPAAQVPTAQQPEPMSDIAAAVAVDAELAEARALFERNIKAVQDRDRDGYLACYSPTDLLVRAGGEGVKIGYDDLASGTPANGSDEWPEKLEASNMRVFWLRPGLVYGTYDYRVTIAGETTTGVSERVFARGNDGWRIVVTTAFETP